MYVVPVPAQQQHGQRQHQGAGGRLDHAPYRGAAQHGGEAPRAQAEGAEPQHRGRHCAQREGRARLAGQAAADGAEQHHGVEVDVRVEEGQRQHGDQGPLQGQRVVLAGQGQRRAAAQAARPAAPAIPGEEGAAAIPRQRQQRRRGFDERAEAGHAERDQHHVDDDAGEHGGEHVLAAHAGADDVGILRTDRHDQAGAEAQPLEKHLLGKHHSSLQLLA
jgi:hypothetical protein